MTDQAPKANILLVDDDKFLAEMYAMRFAREGYNVHTSLSADDGLTVLRGGFPADAILFDIVMPGKDGFAFLAALSDERLVPHALRIALTNQSDDLERKKAIELGATDYLIKAATIPSEVVNSVATALSRAGKA